MSTTVQTVASPVEKARLLYQGLAAGQRLSASPLVASWQQSGEAILCEYRVQVERWRSAQVRYPVRRTFAMGPSWWYGPAHTLITAAENAAARRRAQRLAAPQWRWFGEYSVALTQHRMVFSFPKGSESVPWTAVDIHPDLASGSVVLTAADREPFRLTGPRVCELAVVARWCRFGPAGLHHPGLAALFPY